MGAATIRAVSHLCPPYICCSCFGASSAQCQEEEVCENSENKVAGGGSALLPSRDCCPSSCCPHFLSWLPPLLAITNSQVIASAVFIIIIIIVLITVLIITISFHLASTHTLLRQTSHLSLKNPGSLNLFSFIDTFPSEYASFPLFT